MDVSPTKSLMELNSFLTEAGGPGARYWDIPGPPRCSLECSWGSLCLQDRSQTVAGWSWNRVSDPVRLHGAADRIVQSPCGTVAGWRL